MRARGTGGKEREDIQKNRQLNRQTRYYTKRDRFSDGQPTGK